MEPQSPPPPGADVSSLAKAVRRLTWAVWCLIVLSIVMYAVPWISYLRFRITDGPSDPTAAADSPTTLASEPEFDNDFHARPPEEKIRRATVILVTQIQREPGKHKEVIREIVKHSPNVRFYYQVGDEYERISHAPAPDCTDCEGQGQVVFLIGNPALMALSYSYRNDRIEGMGGMSLTELRQLAQPSK
jgi:hypothetical protein